MAENKYSTSSLINISADNFEVKKGNIIREGNAIRLGANSRCTFSYNYSSEKIRDSNKLKIDYDIKADGISTRYNDDISIVLNINFYKLDNNEYIDGGYQNVVVIPYTNSEDKGNITVEEIDLKEIYIKSLTVDIVFNSEDEGTEIIVNKLGIYKTINVDDDYIIDTVKDALYNNLMELVIPLIDKLPDINDVPDGAIFRCSWIEGVS